MSLATGNVRLQLRQIIRRFKFDELELAVLPIFPEITWNKLRSSMIRHHQQFTVSASIHIIEQMIKDLEIGDADLRDRLSSLQLIDISRHSIRKVWTCYELRGVITPLDVQSDREIEERVSASFLRNIQRMDVKVTSHDGITFVLVKDANLGKRRKNRIYPVFFAFLNGQKHFFTSRKTVGRDYLIAMAEGLGYTDIKLAKLSGKDLKSLIKLLWAKQQATINNENILKTPAYTDLAPVVRKTGIDFTEAKQRGEYADKCFGLEPPSTQLLQLMFVNQTWKCTKLVPEIEDENIDIKWEFNSRHIPKMIKELVQRRIMRIPLPIYAENMLTIGRNEMTLRS